MTAEEIEKYLRELLEDIEFLLEKLQFKTIAEVLETVANYYPNKQIKPETVFLLEELLERRK